MGIVIRQSIKNTISTYVGFILGAFNVLFLYTYFLSDEYHGLLAFIISTATIMLPFISLGTHNAIIKFYSFYNTPDEKKLLFKYNVNHSFNQRNHFSFSRINIYGFY